jgi:hypothetical protein
VASDALQPQQCCQHEPRRRPRKQPRIMNKSGVKNIHFLRVVTVIVSRRDAIGQPRCGWQCVALGDSVASVVCLALIHTRRGPDSLQIRGPWMGSKDSTDSGFCLDRQSRSLCLSFMQRCNPRLRGARSVCSCFLWPFFDLIVPPLSGPFNVKSSRSSVADRRGSDANLSRQLAPRSSRH